jgi:hypothetical protein
MTEQLHRLIDNGAEQSVINERVAGLIEVIRTAAQDHEKRIRFIERTVSYSLGVIGTFSAILYLISVLKK